MKSFEGRTAVITGAGSGFGLEAARIAARKGMHVVMADVQQDALDQAAADVTALGAQVLAYRLDVSKADEVEALGAAVLQRFGAPHVVFNNAGVGAGGLIWENSLADWEWVLGVNLMGVVHGVRVFTPMMLAAAGADPGYEGHIVNTASMAGLVNMPNMGVYNVSKHAVVSLSESLLFDLRQRGCAIGHHHMSQRKESFGLLGFHQSNQEIRITYRVMFEMQAHGPILFLTHTANDDGKLSLRAADVAAAF